MFKKVKCSSLEKGTTREGKTRVISELGAKYPLKILFEISGIARATYYFYVNKGDKDIIIDEIKKIFFTHKGRYGYRRITLELKNQGLTINHKKVLRLMNKLNLQAITRRKRKYSSYRGAIGKIADNHIKRNFEANKPNEKCFTDVTEFNLRGTKLYLSSISDAYGRYVSYNISRSADLSQVIDTLNKAFKDNSNINNLIFYSDQGWQYQHNFYIERLKKRILSKVCQEKEIA